jgi:TM2 domain-containing membrane protein YozV
MTDTPAAPATPEPAAAAVPQVTVNLQGYPQLPPLPPKSTGAAYGLWLLSLIGIAGIHRMYIGKVGTGILWLLTVGIFFIGTIIDLFTLASQVRAANARRAVGIK